MQAAKSAFFIKAKEFYEKAKTIKNIEIIVAVILIAIVLLIYASSVNSQAKYTSNLDTSTTNTLEIEDRLANVLSQIEGVGRVSVMITYKEELTTKSVSTLGNKEVKSSESDIKGVIIVAEGANDIAVKLNLIRATQAVLNINANTIEVFAMKNK